MEINIESEIAACQRRLSNGEVDGEPVRILTIQKEFATDVDDLWNALTTIERIPNWFLPISGELKEGGNYAFEGNASGQILKCNAQNRFEITWEYGGQVSWVNVSLEPMGENTKFTLEHLAMVPDEMWKEYGPGAVGLGWESGLIGLTLHIDTGATPAPEDGMIWMGSPNGKAFMKACSEAWCQASIEFGTPAEEAKVAAEKTTAAYTADPPTEE